MTDFLYYFTQDTEVNDVIVDKHIYIYIYIMFVDESEINNLKEYNTCFLLLMKTYKMLWSTRSKAFLKSIKKTSDGASSVFSY